MNRLKLVIVLRIAFLLSCSIPAFSQSIIGYARLWNANVFRYCGFALEIA